MSYSDKTEHYQFPVWIGTDKGTWMDLSAAMADIDTAIWNAASDGSTATNTANSAMNTANAANGTAQTALSKADTAIADADSAQTTANAANTTAQQASTIAGLAKATAETGINYPLLPAQYQQLQLQGADTSGANNILYYAGVIYNNPADTGLPLYFTVPKTYNAGGLTGNPTYTVVPITGGDALTGLSASTPTVVPGTNVYQITITGADLTDKQLYFVQLFVLVHNTTTQEG